jgi:hypothetical protein
MRGIAFNSREDASVIAWKNKLMAFLDEPTGPEMIWWVPLDEAEAKLKLKDKEIEQLKGIIREQIEWRRTR